MYELHWNPQVGAALPRCTRTCDGTAHPNLERVRSELAQLPTVEIVAVFTVHFLSSTFGTACWSGGRVNKSRTTELVTLAEAMNGPTGVAKAFLIGLSVTIMAGTINSAQAAIDNVAASAQKVARLTEDLSDPSRADIVARDPQRYLRALSVSCPRPRTHRDPAASQALSAAGQIAENQVRLLSIAPQKLPTSVLWSLLVAATLSSRVMGIIATTMTRRSCRWAGHSSQQWASVVALRLYNPSTGDGAVDMQPVRDGVQRILTP